MCTAVYIYRNNLKAVRDVLALEAAPPEGDWNRLLLEDRVPIIRAEKGRSTAWALPRWKANQKRDGRPYASFNVRADRLLENKLWRDACGRRHGLLVCEGFFEKAERGDSRQYRFFCRADDRPMALAVLWAKDEEQTGSEILTVVTTEAGSGVEAYHSRMPVILEESLWRSWLHPESCNQGADWQVWMQIPPCSLRNWRVTNDLFRRSLPNDPTLLQEYQGDDWRQEELW